MPKYKKKADELQAFKTTDPLSPRLREASTLIGRGKNEEALVALNTLVSDGIDDAEKLSQIVSMIGDAEFSLGRFENSLSAYKRAGEVLAGELRIRIWIRPALGEVRSLLQALEAEKALVRANEIWSRSVASHAQLQAEIAEAEASLQSQGRIKISQRPVRPSVVLTRLGSIFLEEGYVEVAKHFFQQAVLTTPRGATRARQGMALVSLSEDEPAEAEKYAREALQMGKFQAKTICAWEILIKARAKQNKDLLDQELYTSLNLNQSGKVRARAVLSIVRQLRAYGDARWKGIAKEWVERDSVVDEIVEVELAKILLADEKLIGGDSDLMALSAFRIFRSDQVSPKEMVANAKELVFILLSQNKPVDFQALAEKAKRRFRRKLEGEVIHGMALGAMKAKRHDLARQLLVSQLNELPSSSRHWSISCSALARMELVLDNYDAASQAYFNMAQNPECAPEFRIQALVNWADSISKSDSTQEVDLESFEALLDSLIPELNSYQQLLLVARKLTLSKVKSLSLVEEILGRAKTAVESEFEEAVSPENANLIMVRYCRKLFFDFRMFDEVILTWSSLAASKQDWLWSQKGEFWEWLSLVASSHFQLGQMAEGDAFVSSILEGGSLVPEGKLRFSILKADQMIFRGQFGQASPLLNDAILESPTHRVTATAYHWLGVKALAEGNHEAAKQRFEGLRKCFAGKPSLLSEWELDAMALLVLNQRSATRVFENFQGIYSKEFLNKQNARLGELILFLSE